MLISILLVFFATAVAVIFAKDWVPIVARYARIPVIKLVLPLTFVSCVVMFYQLWIIKGLSLIWSVYVIFMAFIVEHTSAFYMKFLLYQAALITLLSLVPTFFAYMTAKPFRPFNPPYWGSIMIWIGLSVLISLLEGSL